MSRSARMPSIGPRRIAALLGAVAVAGIAVVANMIVGVTGLVWVVLGLQSLLLLSVAYTYAGSQRSRARVARSVEELDGRLKHVHQELTTLDGRIADVDLRVSDVDRRVVRLREPIDRNRRDSETLIARHHRQTQQRIDVSYRQLEALTALYYDVRPRQSFPPLRGWALSPDFLRDLYQFVLDRRPNQVLECGSGISTVVIAYALQQVGRGRIVALEHVDQHRATSVALLRAHGLTDQAEVRLALLTPVSIDGENWLWYDRRQLPEDPLDLLLVDGPPAKTQPLARYPALPLLRERLAGNATVMLDDLVREDEREIVNRWRERYPDFDFEERPHEKGTGVFHVT